MRKSTKIAVVLAAAALLVAGFAFTTLAKGWVKEAEGLYYYEDAEGMKVYNEWQKDTDPNTGKVSYYYLGDDGYMVTNTLVETDGKFYWCGADGAKVVDQWIKVPVEDTESNFDQEYRWYRFDSKGQALAGKKADVNGETYFFDNEGKMLFGYVQYIKDTEPSMKKSIADPSDGVSYNYYCGTNDEGNALKGNWRKEVIDTSASTYEDSKSFWTYFKSTGVKATLDNSENGALVNGVRYYFDENGTMLTSWQSATDSTDETATAACYFGGDDDGKMVKKAWAYVKPVDGGDDKFWYYFNNAGQAIKNPGVYKINGKFYAFGKAVKNASPMLSGMVDLSFDVAKENPFITDATAAVKVKAGDYTLAEWLAKSDLDDVYYFSGDEVNDGSLKKNVSFNADFKDDTYSLAVDTAGKLCNYYNTKAKKYYKNGYLLKAEEDVRYQMVKVWVQDDTTKEVTSKKTLLTTSGSEVASGTVTDADGNYYYVVKATTEEPKKIYRADSSLLSAAKAVSAFKNKTTTTIDGIKYDAYADASKEAENGYINIKLKKHVD